MSLIILLNISFPVNGHTGIHFSPEHIGIWDFIFHFCPILEYHIQVASSQIKFEFLYFLVLEIPDYFGIFHRGRRLSHCSKQHYRNQDQQRKYRQIDPDALRFFVQTCFTPVEYILPGLEKTAPIFHSNYLLYTFGSKIPT